MGFFGGCAGVEAKGSLRSLDCGYCSCMIVMIQRILSRGTNSVGQVWCGALGIVLFLAVRLSSENEIRTGCVWDKVLGHRSSTW